MLRVKHRKDKADEIASVNSVVNNYSKSEDRSLNYKDKSADLLSEYLNKILVIHNTQLNFAQEKWDSGITTKMNQGNYDMVDFYEEILVELSTFYPKGHFENKNPRDYFSEIISSKFKYHSLILEPEGVGTGGTIISTMTGGNVMADLKRMISDMVIALTWPYDIDDKINLKNGKKIGFR